MNERSPNKYLIVGPSWVGDMVMAQTLFTLIRKDEPDAIIDVLAPPWTHPLLHYMNEVSEALVSPFKHGEISLLERFRLGRKLRDKKYSHAIVLPNSFKSALVPWFAKIPKRIGWKGEARYGLLNDIRILDKTKWPLMIQRFMALGIPGTHADQTIVPSLDIPEADKQAAVQKYSIDLSQGQPYVFAPGAEYGPAKRWPYYGEVARKLSEAGHPVWILGSPKDAELVDTIMANQNERVRNFIGKTSLSDAIALIALAKFVLTNDSGLMHVAAALNKPMLAVYGSSDTRFTPPLSDKSKVITLNLECSPCFKRTCPLGHMDCLNKISPEMVLKEMESWETACAY